MPGSLHAHGIDMSYLSNFSDPADADYPDIAWARDFECAQIKQWIREHQQASK